jgi:hypothetical protein
MSVNELLKMPSEKAAQLLLDRHPTKCWALHRALHDLLDTGTVPRPASGWVADRARTAHEGLTAR